MSNKKIKVLHFEIDGKIGGIETFLLNLYKNIDRRNIQFGFVTRSKEIPFQKDILDLGGCIEYIEGFNNIFQYIKDITRILNKGYDIVHIHKNSAANIIPFILAKKYGLPIVSHSHNTRPSCGTLSYVLHYINRVLLYKLSDVHLACSQDAGKWLYSNKKFQVVKNGVIVNNFLYDDKIASIKRKELSINDNQLVIGHIGRFTKQKNHEGLVKIFKEMLVNKPDAILLLIGDGPLKAGITNMVKKMGLDDSVMMLGIRKDIPELLMAMDVFLMPSLYEGLPIAAVEAQASGVDVFLSNTISQQTEIISSVKWFDNKWDYKMIADFVCNSYKLYRKNVRKNANKQVANAGFDIDYTASELSKKYQFLIFAACNKR